MLRPLLLTLLVLLSGFAVADQGKIVLGRLGQANESTRIYAAPNSHARVYYRVKASEYLVVKDSPKSAYLEVLLQNGVYGFIPTIAVNELPYTVTTKKETDLASRSGVAGYATRFVGVPYRWGGTDVSSGIDCSAFVKKMYGAIGISLPRTAAEQALVGQPITRLEDLRAGDRLYFWDAGRGKIGHTGIYRGDGTFVHSSHGKGGVGVSALTPSWRRILVAARR